jgi:hypothetical protein
MRKFLTQVGTKAKNMESYLIRIYRRSIDPPEVIGVVQSVDQQNSSKPFHNLQELMVLLAEKAATEAKTFKSTKALKK